jgi:hypothetical protein
MRGECGNSHTDLPACFVADKWEQPHSGVAKQHFLFAEILFWEWIILLATFVMQSACSAHYSKSQPSAQQGTYCKRVSDLPSRATSGSNDQHSRTSLDALRKDITMITMESLISLVEKISVFL